MHYEVLGASEYVVSDYVKVSHLWQRFEDSGDEKTLREAAKVMCGTFGRLSGDQEFWAAAIDAVGDIEHQGQVVREVLADLREFREIEVNLLMKAGVPPEQASKLVSELITAIRITEELPRGNAVLNLQGRVEALGSQICEIAQAHEVRPPRCRRRVVRGMQILGGAATVVVDGVTAPALPIALVSVGGGLLLMGAEAIDE